LDSLKFSLRQATAIGFSGIQCHGKRVRFYSTVVLANMLELEMASGKHVRLALGLMQMDLDILNKLGCLPFSQAGDYGIIGSCNASLRYPGNRERFLPFQATEKQIAANRKSGKNWTLIGIKFQPAPTFHS